MFLPIYFLCLLSITEKGQGICLILDDGGQTLWRLLLLGLPIVLLLDDLVLLFIGIIDLSIKKE